MTPPHQALNRAPRSTAYPTHALRRPRERARWWALVTAVVFFALLIGIGSIPNQASQLSAFLPDKVLHMMAYGFLAGLLYLGQRTDSRWRSVKAVLAIAVLGTVDEGVQSLFPYRSAGIDDWLFNMLAAALVVGSLTCFSKGPSR